MTLRESQSQKNKADLQNMSPQAEENSGEGWQQARPLDI